MAFEYANVKIALKNWIIDNVTGYALDANSVWTAPPKAKQVSRYPIVVILSAASRPRLDAGILIMQHRLNVGFICKGDSSSAASDTLCGMLKEFDTAWIDAAKKLDTSLGGWGRRAQEGEETTFDPVDVDEFGVLVFQATKTVMIEEKIQAVEF